MAAALSCRLLCSAAQSDRGSSEPGSGPGSGPERSGLVLQDLGHWAAEKEGSRTASPELPGVWCIQQMMSHLSGFLT